MELWPPVPKGTQEVFPGGRCPRCQSPRVHRSRTITPSAKLLRVVSPLRSFRCPACGWRGYRRSAVGDGPELALPPLTEEVKARHSSSGSNRDHAHVSRSRRRWLLQVVLTLLLAAAAGGVVARLQGS